MPSKQKKTQKAEKKEESIHRRSTADTTTLFGSAQHSISEAVAELSPRSSKPRAPTEGLTMVGPHLPTKAELPGEPMINMLMTPPSHLPSLEGLAWYKRIKGQRQPTQKHDHRRSTGVVLVDTNPADSLRAQADKKLKEANELEAEASRQLAQFQRKMQEAQTDRGQATILVDSATNLEDLKPVAAAAATAAPFDVLD